MEVKYMTRDAPRGVRAEQSWELGMNACSLGEYDAGDWSSGNTPYVMGEWTLGGAALSDEDKWWLGEECEDMQYRLGDIQDRKGAREKTKLDEHRDRGEWALEAEAKYAKREVGENKYVEVLDEVEWRRVIKEIERLKQLDQRRGMSGSKLAETLGINKESELDGGEEETGGSVGAEKGKEDVTAAARVEVDHAYMLAEESDKAADLSQINQETFSNTTDPQQSRSKIVMLPVNLSSVDDVRSAVKSNAVMSAELLTQVQGKTDRYPCKAPLGCRGKVIGQGPQNHGTGIGKQRQNWVEELMAWLQTPVDRLPHVLDLRLEEEVLARANRVTVGDKGKGLKRVD